MEFETKEAAEYALFAMNNRNVFDKVSKDKVSLLFFIFWLFSSFFSHSSLVIS